VLARNDEVRVGRTTHGASAAWIVILAGLLAATVAGLSLRPPTDVRLSWWKVLLQASVWVVGTALAGTLAMGLAAASLRQRWGRLFRVDAVEAGAAWLLLPPLLLLAGRASGWALVFAAGVAGVIAACLRGMIPAEPPLNESPEGAGPFFAELPAPDSGRGQAAAIAVCLECAVVLAFRRQVALAILLTAAASFLFVWKRLTMLLRIRGESTVRPVLRSAAAAVLALLLVVPPLLMKLVRMGPGGTGGGAAAQAANAKKDARAQEAANDAYRGIILFTVHKDAVLAPTAARPALQSGMRKPLIIPFDGAYWYFQTPRQGPGAHAHLARGDPVAVSIHSTGWIPLAMQAHQVLAHAVELGCCGSMQVTVRNGDNRPGWIDMGVLLTDSTAPGKPSVFLGTKPIVSTEENHFALKPVPVDEVLTFTIPSHTAVRKFDQITVLFFPAAERATLGARVGIEQFELEPR